MGAGGQAIIQVLFGLNIADSKSLISDDVKKLNKQLSSKNSTIKVKLPVIIDSDSLEKAVETINNKIKDIKLDGLDLSRAVKDAKIEVGVNDASLNKLGVKIDTLTHSIDALNNTISGRISPAAAGGTPISPKGMPGGGGASVGGGKTPPKTPVYSDVIRDEKNQRAYIGAKKSSEVKVVTKDEIVLGGDTVGNTVFSGEVNRELKDIIRKNLKDGELSKEMAGQIKDGLPALMKKVFHDTAVMASASGKNHVEFPFDDEYFVGVAKSYEGLVDSYVKAPASLPEPEKIASFTHFAKDIVNGKIYESLSKDKKYADKAPSEIYQAAVDQIKKNIANSSPEPLTKELAESLDTGTFFDKIEEQAEQADEDLENIAKKLGVAKEELTPVGQAMKNLNDEQKRAINLQREKAGISDDQAIAIANIEANKSKEEELAQARKKAAEETEKAAEKIGEAQQEYLDGQVANEGKSKKEKTKQDKEYNKVKKKLGKKNVEQTEEETKALEDQIEKQRELNEENAKATVRGSPNTFNVKSGNANPDYIPESGSISQEILANKPKGEAQVKGSVGQLSKLTSLFERLGSARTRNDLVDAEKAFNELNELIDDPKKLGQKALKAYQGGSVWNAAHAKALESGAKGSEITKKTAEITRDILKGYLGNILSFDSKGNPSFVKTLSQKAFESIQAIESKSRSLISDDEMRELNALRHSASIGTWGDEQQKKLDVISDSIKLKADEAAEKEREALELAIQNSNKLIDIARDTSLSLEQQVDKALGTYGYKGVYGTPKNILEQIGRAMGLNISKDGTITEIDNRTKFIEESVKANEHWRKLAYPTKNADFGKEVYNTIGNNLNSNYYGLVNRISRSRFGYPVTGGYEDTSGKYLTNNLLKQQAESLNKEITATVNTFIEQLKQFSARWRTFKSDAEGVQEVWRMIGETTRGGQPTASGRVMLDILEGLMSGKLGYYTAIEMFDLQETREGLALVEEGKKLLLSEGAAEEQVARVRASSLRELAAQSPLIQSIIDLAQKYGVEWVRVTDWIREANGEYMTLATTMRLLTQNLEESPLNDLKKEIKALGSGVNVVYGDETIKKLPHSTRAETSSAQEGSYERIKAAAKGAAAAQREFAQASDDAERETRETGEAAEEQASQWDRYHEALLKIEETYESLLTLAPNLKKKLTALHNKNNAGTLNDDDISKLEDTLSKYNNYGIDKYTFESNFKPQFDNIISTLKEAGAETGEFEARWAELQAQFAAPGFKMGYDQLADFYKVLKQAKDSIKPIKDEAFEALKTKQLGVSFDTLGQKITIFGEKYKSVLRMNPELSNAFNELRDNFNNVNNSANRSQKNLGTLTTTLNALKQQAYDSLTPLQKFAYKVKNVFGERLLFMASTMVVSQIFGQFRNLYNSVSEVDKAMTELKKVTDLTSNAYDSFLRRAASQAKELGATVSDLVDATADFARLGYNMSDAENLAKTATVYKNVGDGITDIGTASESIISTMKAFGIEAKNSMDIVDAFNEVGNNFAISSTGIGEALSRSASALATANNDLDESIALVVAGNAVVQNPDTVGTALKTLSMRIRGAKTELEDAGESTEGMASSISKLREEVKLLTGNKVDIMLDSKNFKSTYDILGEISKVWNDINDIDQANLLELLGGKRNANVLSSILTNFKDAEAVIKTIAGDAGSAMKEQDKWLDSIEGKTQQLKASGQTLAIDLIDTEAVKLALELITNLIDKLDWLANHKGMAAGFIGIFSSFKMFTHLESTAIGLSNGLKLLSSTFKGIGESLSVFEHPIKNVQNAFKSLNQATKANIINGVDFANGKIKEAAASEGSAAATAVDTVEKNKNAVATTTATGVTTGFATALSLVTAAISIGVIAWSVWNSNVQKHKQAAEDAAQNYEDTARSIEEYTEKIKEARKELDESDSQAARLEKTEELRRIEEELVELYGKQAEGIDLVNGKLDEELEKLEAVNRENARDVYTKYTDRRSGFFSSEAEKAANAYNQGNTVWLKGVAKGEQAAEIRKFVESIHGSINAYKDRFGTEDSFQVVGDLNEQKRVLGELFDYIEARSKESGDVFNKDTLQSINKAYNDVTEDIDKYSKTIALVGESYFLRQDDTKELESYLGYLKLIEDYQAAIKSEDYNTAASLMNRMQEWLKGIDEFPAVVQQYLLNLFSDAIPVDMQVILNLIPKVMKDENLQNALSKYKNEFGQIDIKLIYADAKKGTDNYKKLKDSAKGYEESIEEIVDACNTYNKIELEDKFGEMQNKSLSTREYLANLNDVSDGLEAFKKIYDDISDGDTIDLGAIISGDFAEKFGKLDGYEEFLKVLSSSPNDIKKCQDALNSLANEYIRDTKILDNLSDENRDLTVAILQQKGVANAAKIVDEKLAAQKEVNAIYSSKLANATLSEAASIIYESNASNLAKQELAKLYIEKLNVNNTTIKTAADIANLIALANQANATAESLRRLNRAKSYTERADTLYKNEGDSRTVQKLRGMAQKALDQPIEYNEYEYKDIEYKGNASGSSGGGGSSSGGGGGSGTDQYLENWKKAVEDKKKLVEEDKWTTKQYYEWLEDANKKSGGLAATPALEAKYADEIRDIKQELYQWEKDSVQKSIDEQDAILKNKRVNGLISEAEYQKQLAEITENGYKELERKISDEGLFGVDTEERVNAETELLEKVKSAHKSAYDAEIKELDHLRSMNLITDEQYYAKHAALVAKYFGQEKMYAEELKEEEEKLYKERIDLVKKYSAAAKEAISSIMNIGKDIADAINDLVNGIVDANSSNFDLQKNLLDHALEMNYISEKEYYDRLENLYKTYYKSKSVYLDEYMEYEAEIYQHEMDVLDSGASAMESVHAKVIDLIRAELEEAKDAIDETKDKYLDLIDIRRKALEKEKDENDYEKGRVEKLNSIAELQRQVNALANDTTAKGQKAYQEAYAKLIKAQRELKEYEEDHAYDMAMDQLDKEADAFEKNAKSETDAIDKQLEDNEWLVSEAWARLQGMNEELYNQLIDYTHKHSTEIKDSVTGEWETAKDAFNSYINDIKNGYYTVEDILNHPEIYNKGISDSQYTEYATITKQKEYENYAKVLGEFAESLANIMGESFQSVAGLLNTLFPSPITDLLVDGADGFASAMGIAGINNSLLSTVAALGGITGIMEMMSGFQDLAEGNTSNMGVAIGGENINSVLGLLQSIQGYQQGLGVSTDTTNLLLTSILGATMAGPTQGSSVVTGLLVLGTTMASLLGVGTTLLGGGGTGAATLFSLLQGLGGLLGTGNTIDMQNATSISGLTTVILNLVGYAAGLLGSSQTTNSELSGLRALLLNGWNGIYNLLTTIISTTSSSGMMGGLIGSLSTIAQVFGGIIGNNGGYIPISLANLPAGTSDSFAKLLGSSVDLMGGVISKVGEVSAKVLPNIASNRMGDVTISPIFDIKSTDPDGVADAVMRLMPKIADLAISTMMDSASNRGVKRYASALV